MEVDHYQLDNNNPEEPVNRYYLKIKPAKGGPPIRCTVSANEIASPGGFTQMFLQRARVLWEGDKQPSMALTRRIIEAGAPVVRQLHRNRLIVGDVIQEARSGDNLSLVLSDRKAHLDALYNLLKSQGVDAVILTSDVPKKQREQIIRDFESGALRVILATGQLAGEGLDMSKLNRLFVTTPIRWKGRVIQYAGRALRTADGKNDARIYDYHDSNVGILSASFRSRCRVYEGFN